MPERAPLPAPRLRQAGSNHENCFPLSLVEDPAKLWREWERVGVRVSQSLCPLTSILSPRGERRYIRCYFLHNTPCPGGHPRTMKIVSPSPLSKIPLNYGGDGGGLRWG